jgi:hypothetical protein
MNIETVMHAESTVSIPAKTYLFGAMMEKIKHALSCLITKINAEVQIKCRSRSIKTGKEYSITAYLFGALMRKNALSCLITKISTEQRSTY